MKEKGYKYNVFLGINIENRPTKPCSFKSSVRIRIYNFPQPEGNLIAYIFSSPNTPIIFLSLTYKCDNMHIIVISD